MTPYLESSEYLDWQHPVILAKVKELVDLPCSDDVVAQRCYEFVRDSIQQSWDHQKHPITCKASDVLIHGTGYSF